MVTWKYTYEQIVYEIENTSIDPPSAISHIYNVLYLLIDLMKSNLNISEYGTEAEITLLYKVNKFLNWTRDTWNMGPERKKIIKAINDFTINYYGDLTTFINDINWNNGCIPYNWANISSDIGYDISEWNVCIS